MGYNQEYFIPYAKGGPSGIVFFGHVFPIAHEIYEGLITNAMAIPWAEWFNNPSWIVPIKSTQAHFNDPLIPGEYYSIHASVKKIGTCSFETTYRFFQKDLLCCEISLVHVFCSRETMKKIPIPPHLVEPLESQKVPNGFS